MMLSHGSPAAETAVRLSVVVRTRNNAQNLKNLLDALAAQRCSFRWEVVVVDNESTDETQDICDAYRARRVFIDQRDFTAGRALNLGIRHARGELVLLCSPHSIPVGSDFLENCVAPFADPQMAAVRCLHATNRQQMLKWYAPSDIQYASASQQKSAESGIGWVGHYPSATCCVIRRSVWEQIPYDEELESSEDKIWASRVLSKGFKIRSCAEAIFVYNARRSRIETWKNRARAFRALYRVTGYVPLTWPQFFARLVRYSFLAPLAAVRYLVENVGYDLFLVTIPWQAKRRAVPGSFREYRRRKHGVRPSST